MEYLHLNGDEGCLMALRSLARVIGRYAPERDGKDQGLRTPPATWKTVASVHRAMT